MRGKNVPFWDSLGLVLQQMCQYAQALRASRPSQSPKTKAKDIH